MYVYIYIYIHTSCWSASDITHLYYKASLLGLQSCAENTREVTKDDYGIVPKMPKIIPLNNLRISGYLINNFNQRLLWANLWIGNANK